MDIDLSKLSDEDWDKFEQEFAKAAKKRGTYGKLIDNICEMTDNYNEQLDDILHALSCRNAAELLSYKFIDPYDISVFTHLPLKEILIIKMRMEAFVSAERNAELEKLAGL